jgi:hypothetical protein
VRLNKHVCAVQPDKTGKISSEKLRATIKVSTRRAGHRGAMSHLQFAVQLSSAAVGLPVGTHRLMAHGWQHWPLSQQQLNVT